MDKALETYCIQHSYRPSELSRELADYTRANISGSQMLIGELEASLLVFLLRMLGAKRVLELGTFTGYSSLCMAEVLPAEGEIVTVDVNPGTTELAKRFWSRSPHGSKIKAVLAPGEEYLPTLSESFDFIFIDADKVNYPFYVTWARDHLNPQGVIVVDNALWSGRVLDEKPELQTQKIKEATQLAAGWKDFMTTLLPVRDGMLLIRRLN